jgi:formate hydrogenlyase subunit 3/multisubunit Na+/H+ antiporter MnhD subunit
MGTQIWKILTGLVGMVLMLLFLAVPVIKLKDVPMAIVMLIGVAAMVYYFIEVVRGKDEA